MSQAEENLDNTTMGSVTAFDATAVPPAAPAAPAPAAPAPAAAGAPAAPPGPPSPNTDITKVAVKWQKKGVMDGRAMPVILGERIYFIDDGAKVYAFDKNTGEPVGKPQKLLGTIVRGSPLVADGKLYVCSTGGWHVLAPTVDGLKFVNRMRLPEADEVTASPIACNGRIYLTTGERLICIGTPDAKGSDAAVETSPERVAAATAGKPGEPVTVQIVPAEAQVAAGGTIKLKARLFDAAGRFVKESPAEFAATAGAVAADGTYTAPAGKHAASIVTAKVGKLAGKARIRSMPPLPWKFDFEEITLDKDAKTGVVKGEPPLPWIGMRYRHVVREVDGSKVLVKITTIAKGTRSQGWIGPIDLHDYSIRADFRAAESGVGKPGDPATPVAADAAKPAGSDAEAFAKAFGNPAALEKARMPDMGLIAQRYTLDLMGASQQLQLRTWPPQVATHFSKTVPFAWEAGKWYTFVLEARTAPEGAILRGKVWPRGEAEPAEWTIEGVHAGGNLQGSPGFFGQSKDSEIYIDNVSVSPVTPGKKQP
jgi:hypothetical protein